jgi:hypothetical protein
MLLERRPARGLLQTECAPRREPIDRLTAIAGQAQTPTNKWGTEVAMLDGVVLSVTDRQVSDAPAIVIPPGGYVLSGHYNAGMWLSANATIGAPVMNRSCTGCPSEFDGGERGLEQLRHASKIRGGHFSGGISSSDKSRVLQWLDCGAP